jgi:beta-fructofuranosidase
MTPRGLAGFLLALSLLPVALRAEDSRDDALARAEAAVEAAVPRAQADPAHPIFHLTAPAQWINDPNGPIFHKGFYHLFYQLHPFSDASGPKYWGHVRSHGLVKWEQLPIALWPSSELGETEVWSGCCTLNGNGQPMIFYTSIARGQSPMEHAEQWAALSDDTMLRWQKSPANPVLTERLHGEKKIYDWRDPFVFREGKKTFLVTGGNLNRARGGEAVVNIYEAQSAELTQWTYRGVLFQLPEARARTAECPNFFRLGRAWVLLVSPYGKVEYFIGDFDSTACRFQPRGRGVLDYGPNFYAPNTMQLSNGRRLVWGWINGFPGGRGWNGCLSLPRQLALGPGGQLRQEPAPELKRLRGESRKWRNLSLAEGGGVLDLPKTNTLEILARFDLQTAETIVVELKGGSGQAVPVTLRFSHSELALMEAKAPLPLADKKELRLRIFMDRSVVEVFANESVCLTKTITPLAGAPVLRLHSENGNARASLVQAWAMKSIW